MLNIFTRFLNNTIFNRLTIFIVLSILLLSLIGFFLYVFKLNSLNYGGALQPLIIPPLIDSRNVQQPIVIDAIKGQHEFVPGVKSKTSGYNGSYLGPTIRLYQGEETQLQFVNKLGEPTNVHGHGLHVSGDIDGGETTIIYPEKLWDISLPITQEASTNWYHPHLMHTTARQVHSGLAGLYLIEDENSLSLNLPNTYGVNDIPLVVQDRNFNNGEMLPYPTQQTEDSGYQSTFIVNGTVNPEIKLPAGLIRLRLLNGANARPYEFYFSDFRPFYKIATEGGLLERPVEIYRIRMAPGERNEIIVDLSDAQSVTMMGKFLWPEYNNFTADFAPRGQLLQLTVDKTITNPDSALPENLNTITRHDLKNVVVKRDFELGDMSINGKQMSHEVDFSVKKDDLELWRVNSDEHPFHMHGVSFQIISQNGQKPAPEDRGWKDTVLPLGNVELLMRFHYTASKEFPYMYHCHILEHEDMGMMGQFVVE
jgi:bilirubin oxidase